MGFSIGGDLPTTSSSSSRNGRAYLLAIGVGLTLPVRDIQTIACAYKNKHADYLCEMVMRASPTTQAPRH
ncbi:uncharacterized protein TRAVEDRAFT_32046 [Trametes versicolor FP-101664 SS1]|uniref:uncharacterized protein n=1 Tax=Trametes versicolor (strain FP-101664) TaxID=717944 RepID=UPI0004622DC2|nr:uncharacterized protein TRAVEDRAFT_32046 [Trametes versicolor FP-101664 SS1]EIW52259.1 hypothetical protein TRAVEDRAFT_32046 [Trametes versicolor FP-101664 SS1]